MLSELKINPRSVNSREHALRMMIASGSSSSSAADTGTSSRDSRNASASFCSGAISATAAATAAGRGALLAEKSWSCVSKFTARRPDEESRSVNVESCSSSGLAKYRLAAVRVSVSVSPTLTIALARMRTLMGCGVPSGPRSAVWSVMSRSTLMALLERVVPLVSSGTSTLLPGPR